MQAELDFYTKVVVLTLFVFGSDARVMYGWLIEESVGIAATTL